MCWPFYVVCMVWVVSRVRREIVRSTYGLSDGHYEVHTLRLIFSIQVMGFFPKDVVVIVGPGMPSQLSG